jgi:O-antigen/teichoic acid export membrane protein
MRFILDLLSLLVAKAALIGLRLTALYIIAGKTTRSDFGLLAIAFTAVEIARYFADWGTDTLAIREFRFPKLDHAQATLAWVLRIRVASSLLAFTLSFGAICVFAMAISLSDKLMISMMSVTSLWATTGVNWLQVRGSLPRVAVFISLLASGSFFAQLIAASAELSVSLQLALLIGFEAAMAGVIWRNCLIDLSAHRWADHPRLKRWFRSSTPIAIATVLAITYSRVDQFYLKYYATADTLGDFSLASRLVEPFLFLGSALSLTLYSRISSLAFETESDVLEKMKGAIRVWIGSVVLFAIFLWVALTALGTVLLADRFPQYVSAPFFLKICCAALVFRLTNLTLGAFIQALNGFSYILRVNAINAATYVMLTFLIGRQFGAPWAALGVVIGEFLAMLMHARSLRARFAGWSHTIERNLHD